MYEQFRNEVAVEAEMTTGGETHVKELLQALDRVAARWEFCRKEMALVPYGEELPEAAKAYLVCKKIEGLSECTLQTYLRTLKIFFRAVQKPPEQVTTNDIRAWLYAYQAERGCTGRSLDKYRGYLAGFFGWAADEGYISRNPMRTIPAIKYEHRPRQNLTQLELEYLREGCATVRDRAIIEFLFSTGCRVSELCGTRKADVDWDARSVHLFGKGRKHRSSYINAKAEVALKNYLAERTDDGEWLFVTERRPYRQMSPAAIEKVVRRIAGAASCAIGKPVTPHVLRHTTATIALQSGMSVAQISKLLGHESINTTMIYAHTSSDAVAAAHKIHVV